MPKRSGRYRQSAAKAWGKLNDLVKQQDPEEFAHDMLDDYIVEHEEEIKESRSAQKLPALDEDRREELAALAQYLELPPRGACEECALEALIRAEQRRLQSMPNPDDTIVGFGEHAKKTYAEVYLDPKYCWTVVREYQLDKAGASKPLRRLAKYIQNRVVEGIAWRPAVHTAWGESQTSHSDSSFARSSWEKPDGQHEQSQRLDQDVQSHREDDGSDPTCSALDGTDVPQINDDTALDQAGRILPS